MKKHTKLLIGILLMLSISMVLVACFGGGGDPSTTTQNEKKEPTIVAEPLAIDDGLYFAALEAVNSSGYNLVDKAVMVYDICLESEGVKIQPDGKIEVSIPAPLADVLNYVVYHILDSEEIEALPARVEDGKIIFETTSFSTFVIATEENYVFADTTPENEHVQLFTLSLIDKFELFMGLKGIDSADDVTIRFNGVVQTEIFDDGDILYIIRNDFYKGQELTISVTPNNGYKFGYLALLKNNGGQGNNQSSSEYVYFYENEITINLGENWDGIMACELYPPESDLEERTFDITAYSERISLDDLTFTLNGVEMKGINTIRKDGGSSYHLIPTIKNGDVLTISANLPANTEFASFRLRDRESWIIEEVFENSITIYVDTNTGSLDLVIKEITYDGITVDGFDAGWDNFYRNSGEEHWNVSVAQGAFKTTPADFSVWVYDDNGNAV